MSFALGAFGAGVVLSNSELSHRAPDLPAAHADFDHPQLFTLNKTGFEPFVARYPELRARIDLVAVQRAEENVSTPRPAGSR